MYCSFKGRNLCFLTAFDGFRLWWWPFGVGVWAIFLTWVMDIWSRVHLAFFDQFSPKTQTDHCKFKSISQYVSWSSWSSSQRIAPFILMKCSSFFHIFSTTSINSCFKKATGWSCWHRFCDVEISRSDSDCFFLSGVSGGERHVQMLLHWTKSKVTTFWDVLLNGCKFHKNSEFYWEKRNFLTSRVLDGMFDGYILCIMTTVWAVSTNEDGLLDAESSWRNAKGDICKPYDSSPHFCKTVPHENVPSWCFFQQGAMSPAPPGSATSTTIIMNSSWIHQLNFVTSSPKLLSSSFLMSFQHCSTFLIMQLLRQWAPFKTSWVFAAVVEVLDSFIRPPTHSIPGWFWRKIVVNILVYEGFDWCLSNWNGCEKLWTSRKTPGLSRNFEIQVHVSNILASKKTANQTKNQWGEWSWPWRSWIDRSRGQWLVGQPSHSPRHWP